MIRNAYSKTSVPSGSICLSFRRVSLHLSPLAAGLPHASASSAAPNPSGWLEAKAAVVFLSRCHDCFPLTYKRGMELMRRLEETLIAAQVTSSPFSLLRKHDGISLG